MEALHLFNTLFNLLGLLPAVIGMVAALVLWQRHPVVSGLVLGGCFLLFGVQFIFALVPIVPVEDGQLRPSYFFLVGILRTLDMVGMALLILAALVGRTAKRPTASQADYAERLPRPPSEGIQTTR